MSGANKRLLRAVIRKVHPDLFNSCVAGVLEGALFAPQFAIPAADLRDEFYPLFMLNTREAFP
jgi:hypothetical protein